MIPSNFKPCEQSQQLELQSFLNRIFKTNNGAFAAAQILNWKYFDQHPLWQGSRSYFLQKKGATVAHAGLAPVRFVVNGASVFSAQLIDWAAEPAAPGAGIQVFNECRKVADTVFTLGGSLDSRRVFPNLKWLRKLDDVCQYARPLRPLRQVLHSRLGLKSPARLARNLVWSLSPALPDSGDWSCRPAEKFDKAWQPSGDMPMIERTPEWLNYLLRCPAAKMEGYLLLRGNGPAGHLLLARVGTQTRIVDIAIESESRADWTQVLAIAAQQAMADSSTFEIAAATSLKWLGEALERCGFRRRAKLPVYMADGTGRLGTASAVEISLAIGDEFYSADDTWPMWT